MNKDRLYLNSSTQNSFTFNKEVVAVFDDMIRRSVPGYEMVLNVLGLLAEQIKTGDCYDLGCSLGAGSLLMALHLKNTKSRVIGIDNAPEMIKQAQINLQLSQQKQVAYYCQDIMEVNIQNAALVAMNFTLQFLPIDERLILLTKIYQGMNPNGQLLLSEKIKFNNPKTAQFQEQLHHAFKQKNGYSLLEISRKRTALENILIPETIEVHRNRLFQAGFKQVEIWYQCFNFVSFIARA